jgi:hypothetical protein
MKSLSGTLKWKPPRRFFSVDVLLDNGKQTKRAYTVPYRSNAKDVARNRSDVDEVLSVTEITYGEYKELCSQEKNKVVRRRGRNKLELEDSYKPKHRY